MPSLRLTAPGHPPTSTPAQEDHVARLGTRQRHRAARSARHRRLRDPLRRPDVHGVRAEEDRVRRQRQEAQQAQAHPRRAARDRQLRSAVRDGRRARRPSKPRPRTRSPTSTRTRKLYEFSERLMHAARPRRAARRADGRGHRDHERRQGLPDPARGRDARRQGRAQPQPREHRRRGQPALGLDHREGGAHAEAGDRLATRCDDDEFKARQVRDEPQAVAR